MLHIKKKPSARKILYPQSTVCNCLAPTQPQAHPPAFLTRMPHATRSQRKMQQRPSMQCNASPLPCLDAQMQPSPQQDRRTYGIYWKARNGLPCHVTQAAPLPHSQSLRRESSRVIACPRAALCRRRIPLPRQPLHTPGKPRRRKRACGASIHVHDRPRRI